MKKVSGAKILKILIYLYLTLPILIFAAGWLAWQWSVAAIICIAAAFICAVRSDRLDMECGIFKGKASVLMGAFGVILVWVFLSGIGEYCFQNSDHGARNSIFRALVEYRWPVRSADGSRGLIYYIGFWLPSALAGKLFGIEAGYFFQMLWACLGIFLVYCVICIYRKKVDWQSIVFLIFFSGLDCLGMLLTHSDGFSLLIPNHLDGWMELQYSSFTTQLFWVFNQAVPAWLATTLILIQRKSGNVFYIWGMVILTSIFPAIGLLPVVVYVLAKGMVRDRANVRRVFSLQNVIGIAVVGALSAVYLAGNSSGNVVMGADMRDELMQRYLLLAAIGLITFGVMAGALFRLGYYKWKQWIMPGGFVIFWVLIIVISIFIFKDTALVRWSSEMEEMPVYEAPAQLMRYLLFCMVDFGVYACFVYRYHKRDLLFYTMVTSLICIPLIRVGNSYDFCMRSSIPCLMVLMLMCLDTLQRLRERQGDSAQEGHLYRAFVILLCIGALTPINEIRRTIMMTSERAQDGQTVAWEEMDVEDELLQQGNFSGECQDNIFYQYFAKQED